MERFTMRIDDNVYFTKGKYKETIPAECESWDVREILKRLADYEDTGLEPGEIKELVTGLTAMRAIVLTGAEAADYMAYRKSKQTKDKPPEPQEETKGCSGECDFCPDANGCEQCGSV